MQNENERLLSEAVEQFARGMHCLRRAGFDWTDILGRIRELAEVLRGRETTRPDLLERLPDMEDGFDEVNTK